MLKAFATTDCIGAPELTYPNLDSVAGDARQREYALLREAWSAPDDSLEEEKFARYAAIGYLVLTSQRLGNVDQGNQQLLSDRFTQNSIGIYGAPEPQEVKKLLVEQHAGFSRYADRPAIDQARLHAVTDVFQGSLGGSIESVEAQHDAELQNLAQQVAVILDARYGEALHIFDPIEQSGVKPTISEVKSVFEAGLAALQPTNNAWKNWGVEITDGQGMSTSTSSQKIKIGKRGDYQASRLKALFAHEALTHALRYIHGQETGDRLMGVGLPGNLDAEEGIGIFMEYAVSGLLPDRVVDRYIDVALALGQTQLPAMNRAQLHDLHTNRLIVRSQAADKPTDPVAISSFAWNHIDRIYRGSLGNSVIGVNTKDIAYHQGFLKIGRYLKQEILQNGHSAESIFEYIMSGCFDPSDSRHRAHVASVSDK